MPPRQAPKSCHTCRRRRRKCDGLQPLCQKCLTDGFECLGYGKLILWERGIASRGKMKGMSFISLPKGASSTPSLPSAGRHLMPRGQEPSVPYESPNLISTEEGSPPVWSIGAITQPHESDNTHLIPLKQSLPDPILHNLNRTARQYLAHFASDLIGFYVLHDLPNNPMRELVSLAATQKSPLLLQILVANAAYHIHNLSTSPGSCNLSIGAYTDSLTAKMKTLSLLSTLLQNFQMTSIDLVLAAILFLLDHDLLDAGKDGWEIHIQGAQRLIEILDTVTEATDNTITNLHAVRMYCLSEMLIMTILGATFRHPSKSTIIISASVDLHELLHFTERNNNLSCPAPLLEILLRSMDLPATIKECIDSENQSSSATATATPSAKDLIESLIHAALSFNPMQWLQTFQPTSPLDSLTQRFHIASALRSAVCLFLVRTKAASLLYSTQHKDRPPLIDIPFHVDQIIHHVSFITPKDATFQSTLWPVFFVGAETRQLSHREWVRRQLSTLWEHMHWGYIRTTQEVLDHIWESRDCYGACDGQNSVDLSWLDEVHKTGVNYLISA